MQNADQTVIMENTRNSQSRFIVFFLILPLLTYISEKFLHIKKSKSNLKEIWVKVFQNLIFYVKLYCIILKKLI